VSNTNVIIPHNVQNTQVSLPNPGCYGPRQNHTPDAINPVIAPVLALYDLGFNILPQPYGMKGGYPWKRLLFTRLPRDHQEYGLAVLFAGDVNVAVMCGRTSGNLFVIDCETPASFQFHIHQLRQRAIPVWAVKTARGGHVYLRTADGEVANIAAGVLPDAEIKGRDGYVLAPPSLHPGGMRYTWLHQEGAAPPVVASSQVDWLARADGTPIALEVTPSGRRTQPPTNLPAIRPEGARFGRSTREYLAHGAACPEGTRNNRLFRAACDFAGNHIALQEALARLTPIASASGLPHHESERTIRSAYSQARNPLRSGTQPHGPRDWQLALAAIAHREWSGRGQQSLRALLLAMVERARLTPDDTPAFRASVRELAEHARLGTATVQRVLASLMQDEEAPVLYAGQDPKSRASLWQFSPAFLEEGRRHTENLDTLNLTPPWLEYSVSDFNGPDAIERSGLGRSGYRLWHLLREAGRALTLTRLAELLRLGLHQVRYAMRKLERRGLVQPAADGWQVIVSAPAGLDALLPRAARAAQRRRERFAQERALFAAFGLFWARLRREMGRYRAALAHLQRQIRGATAALCVPERLVARPSLLPLLIALGGVPRPTLNA
jgi:predicted transcriptional regulator